MFSELLKYTCLGNLQNFTVVYSAHVKVAKFDPCKYGIHYLQQGSIRII